MRYISRREENADGGVCYSVEADKGGHLASECWVETGENGAIRTMGWAHPAHYTGKGDVLVSVEYAVGEGDKLTRNGGNASGAIDAVVESGFKALAEKFPEVAGEVGRCVAEAGRMSKDIRRAWRPHP